MFSFQLEAAKSPALNDPALRRTIYAMLHPPWSRRTLKLHQRTALWILHWSDVVKFSKWELRCCCELAQQYWPPTERQLEKLEGISAKLSRHPIPSLSRPSGTADCRFQASAKQVKL
jgi:hypothetical protein